MNGGRLDLDVSELEPPEPLLRVLEALEELPRGYCLRMIHRLKPRLLYEHLPRLGFLADTREGEKGRCEVYLWRKGDKQAEDLVRREAGELPPWRE
ncbi:MAG TPA: DUF2249 domain-containing protein [Chromatiaceae bacterium]|nr:DUF2249 domain-containing protein [Chromatiaceae bacterium]